MEVYVNGTAYPLRFGMGFLREMNKKISVPVEGMANQKKNVGFRYALGGLFDKDTETLADVILTANKTENPRLTLADVDQLIEETDTEELFEQVLDFLSKANAVKMTLKEVEKAVKEAKEEEEAKKQMRLKAFKEA